MENRTFWLWATVTITTLSFLMVLPRLKIKFDRQIGRIPLKIDQTIGGYEIDFQLFGFRFKRDLEFMPGLDLQGGVRVVLEAEMSKIAKDRRSDALQSAKEVIERRVNFLGVTEPNVYTSVADEKRRIVVELPGVTDTKEVIDTIGQTAQLVFKEPAGAPAKDQPTEDQGENEASPTALPQPSDTWEETQLTGKYLERAQVVFDQQTGQPTVQLIFDEKGAKLFEEITRRNVGKRLAIFLDNRPLMAPPEVQQPISGGEAVIKGNFTVDQANQIAIQLNAGALPVPVKIVQQKNIGPTLGAQTIRASVRAGVLGLLLLMFFMIANYRLLGVFSVLNLLVYGVVTLAIYKFVPVTLTLSGIAGFVLSMGLAVDANILQFERIREELRAGKDKRAAFKVGFARAWDTIRDANTATLMTVFILFNPFDWSFLVTSGTVRGFALTLGIGVLLNLFTGVVVTKALIYSFYPMKR